jgi:hypothetical protein
MTAIAFDLPPDIADRLETRAAFAGLTPSAWIASHLSILLDGDEFMETLGAMIAGLSQVIEESTPS